MKKTVLTILLCVASAGPSFAMNNTQAMRFLMVTAMVQYGEKLYDRGDFDEASAVFNHVLVYDSHQAQALAFLKEMGHSQEISTLNILPESSSVDEQIVRAVDVTDTNSLKAAIGAQKRVIEQLRARINQMKVHLTSPAIAEK